MSWYEDAVAAVLVQAAVGADVAAEVVAGTRPDPAPGTPALARVRRQRTAATQKPERDRDVEAWKTTMDRLDREEREAATAISAVIEPSRVVAYLRDLPETWRKAEGGRGRRMLAEALFSRIKAKGFREIEFELTPNLPLASRRSRRAARIARGRVGGSPTPDCRMIRPRSRRPKRRIDRAQSVIRPMTVARVRQSLRADAAVSPPG
jgi:hypothetical protein